jgi:hypothetical protein
MDEYVNIKTYKGHLISISPMYMYVGPTLPLVPPNLSSLTRINFTKYVMPELFGRLTTTVVRRSSITKKTCAVYQNKKFLVQKPRRHSADSIESSSDESVARRRRRDL